MPVDLELDSSITHCYENYPFLQEGYDNYLVKAKEQNKCFLSYDFRDILIDGLFELDRLHTVEIGDCWDDYMKHYLQPVQRSQGSPLARSWNEFYALPMLPSCENVDGRVWYQQAKIYPIISFVLFETQKRIKRLAACCIPTRSFYRSPSLNVDIRNYELMGYGQLEDLSLAFVTPNTILDEYKAPAIKSLEQDMEGLRKMIGRSRGLNSMTLDFSSDPELWTADTAIVASMVIPYRMIWSHVTTFDVAGLDFATQQFLRLIIVQMPCFTKLLVDQCNLIDGNWAGIFEFLRISNRLTSVELSPDPRFWAGPENYMRRAYFERHSIRYLEDPCEENEDYKQMVREFEQYVVDWPSKSSSKHPNLCSNQTPEASLNYLFDLLISCYDLLSEPTIMDGFCKKFNEYIVGLKYDLGYVIRLSNLYSSVKAS